LEREFSSQESIVAKLEADLSKADQFNSTGKVIEQQRDELQAKVESLEQELDRRAVAFASLEADLSKAKKSLVEKQTSGGQHVIELQTHVQRMQEEIKLLRSELDAEQALGLESVKKLSATELQIQTLVEELSVASINRSNYQSLASKVVSYENLNRENELKIKDLTGQNSRMSDLATEYFENFKGLRDELNDQVKLVAMLQKRLEYAQSSVSVQPDVDGADLENRLHPQELSDLVQQHARDHVLKLKSDFEILIKRKNKIIRKLRKEKANNSNGKSLESDGILASNGHADAADLNRLRVNAPS